MNWKHLITAFALVAGLDCATAAESIPDSCKTGGFALGCQAYTWNRFTVLEAIDKTAACGGKVIEFYPGQKLSAEGPMKLDHDAPEEVVARMQAHLEQSGVRAVNYGVVGIPKDEAGARKVFDFARKLGLRAITTESTESIDTIEKLAKEYDISVGFHNHPRRPNDAGYKVWDPTYILTLVQGRDTRLGAAADTGHWARSGLKPIECLRILKGRVVSVHLKDLNEFGKSNAHDVPYGTGINDIKGVLDELKAQGFAGNISIEYEYHWESSMPEVAQCIGFVRGYGAAK
jgi:sugar phosphate isomerase/epimerase